MISAGFYGVYAELGPAFERTSGHHLLTTRGPSMGDSPEAIPRRLARGETADVVILDGGAADELARRGLVRADSKVELARSMIGMVVRAGATKPDIGSVEAFRSTLLAAKSIAYSDSGSGTYLSTTLFAKLGVATKWQPRVARCGVHHPANPWPRSSHGARRRSVSSKSVN
jgi:molybdate transport system substrate-binding protein